MVESIVQLIEQIPGVIQARLTQDGDQIQEVHIVAEHDRHARQIVRDVESAVAAEFDVRLPRRIISVAQMRGPEDDPPRLALDNVQLKLHNGNTDVAIELTMQGQSYVGNSTSPSARLPRAQAVATATLGAVQASLQNQVSFFLEEITIIRLGDDEAVVTTVHMRQQGKDMLLVGGAYVRGDETESFVRATLSAVNRVHGMLAAG